MFDKVFRTSQDALRWVWANPRLTVPAVLSLALGFGGAAVMFSVVYSTLFPPQPYRDPDRVVIVRMKQMRSGTMTPFTTSDYNDYRAENTVFESMGLFLPSPQPMTITGGAYPDRVLYQYVTASMFPMLGVRAIVGRTFDDSDLKAPAVVLSHSFWKRRFNSDPKVVGTTVVLGGAKYEVIGVMPEGFYIGRFESDVWRQTDPTGILNERKVRWLMLTGRLKAGVSQPQAQASLAALAAKLGELYPETNRDWTVLVSPLQDYGGTALAERLYPFVGAVVFVLLIACTNVTGLLIAHAAGRRKELATRAALGASRGRLVKQLVAESVALALVSGAVSVLVTRWCLALVIANAPPTFKFLHVAALDARVFLFVMAVSLVAGVIIGGFVAWRSSTPDVNAILKQGATGVTSAKRQRALSVLAVAEVALAFVLVVGAGLFIRTLVNLRSYPLGFSTENVLTAEVDLSGSNYRGRIFRRDIAIVPIMPGVPQFHQRLLDDLKRVPTVESVGLASWLPLAQMGSGRRTRSFVIAGEPAPPKEDRTLVLYNTVTPGFFDALRIRAMHGRLIHERDTFEAPWVAVINRTMAKQFWPNESPIGKSITIDIIEEERPREIVGVVDDIQEGWDPNRPPRAEIYAHVFQQPPVYPGDGAQNRFRTSVLIKARPSATLVADLRRTVAQIDPTQPVFQIRTMEEIHVQRDAHARFITIILAMFAGLGTGLAALGVFALVNYAAANRSQEFGIRLALGATTNMLLRNLLTWSAIVAVVGVGIGALLASWQSKLLQAQLFGVTALDVTTFSIAAVLILAIALAAALQSASRVRRLDGAAQLRA